MKIIVLEGLDKSGKHTLQRSLMEELIGRGYSVGVMDFHDYNSETGKLILKWLRGRWDVSQQTIEFIMAADKQAKQEKIERLDKGGVDFLIIDRYTTSQRVYARASGLEDFFIDALQYYMRVPDYEIFLHVDPDTSMSRKGKMGDNDRYESDKEFLSQVESNYHAFYKEASQASSPYYMPYQRKIDATGSTDHVFKEALQWLEFELDLEYKQKEA